MTLHESWLLLLLPGSQGVNMASGCAGTKPHYWLLTTQINNYRQGLLSHHPPIITQARQACGKKWMKQIFQLLIVWAATGNMTPSNLPPWAHYVSCSVSTKRLFQNNLGILKVNKNFIYFVHAVHTNCCIITWCNANNLSWAERNLSLCAGGKWWAEGEHDAEIHDLLSPYPLLIESLTSHFMTRGRKRNAPMSGFKKYFPSWKHFPWSPAGTKMIFDTRHPAPPPAPAALLCACSRSRVARCHNTQD